MNDMIDLASLQANAARLVDAATAAGADACDCVVAHGQSLSAGVRNGQVEDTDRSEGDNISLRVFCGPRVASISANSMKDFTTLAERAVAMAKVSTDDPFQGLAPAERLAADLVDLDLFDPHIPAADELTQRALQCEAAGLEVAGVENSMGASASWGVTGFVLATSHGFEGHYMRSGFSASAAMVAGSGTQMERDYDFHSAVHLEDLESPAEIGKRAGERAVRRLHPRQVPSAKVTVVFDRRIASALLGSLLGAVNGAAVARKTSFLKDSLGKPVANEAINVIDDPLRSRGRGSRPFDGEGMAGKPLSLVTDGVLENWLLDWASARELGMESNARAARGGSGTTPSSTNCYLAPGPRKTADLIASVKNGLLLAETIGHGVNMVTGDYSKGASGYWIENGEIGFPVSEITIAGNLRDMFLNMTPGNDLEFRAAVNAPSLFVEGMTVGGK